jgi:hypothetical protein
VTHWQDSRDAGLWTVTVPGGESRAGPVRDGTARVLTVTGTSSHGALGLTPSHSESVIQWCQWPGPGRAARGLGGHGSGR